jgi:hypothetical protein
MKPSLLISIALFCLPTFVHAAATDLNAAVAGDLAKHGLKNLDAYNFVATETFDGGNRMMYRTTRIGPRQTRNVLLSVNGMSTGEKDVRNFTLARDTYSDDPDAPMKQGDIYRWINVNRIEETIVPGTLVLKETIGDQSYFVFKARTSVGGSAPAELDGMLVYNATDNLVNTIELTYSGAIESRDHGKIESFRLRVTFEKNKTMGMDVPVDLSWTVNGRKGTFSKFDETYSATFGDYKMGGAQ